MSSRGGGKKRARSTKAAATAPTTTTAIQSASATAAGDATLNAAGVTLDAPNNVAATSSRPVTPIPSGAGGGVASDPATGMDMDTNTTAAGVTTTGASPSNATAAAGASSPVPGRGAKSRKLTHTSDATAQAAASGDDATAAGNESIAFQVNAAPALSTEDGALNTSPAVSTPATSVPISSAHASPTNTPTLGNALNPLPLPALPPGLSRGYVAQFYWQQHYHASTGRKKLSDEFLPVFSEVVASIPSIFQQIISILQTAEQKSKNRDILAELDKKIVKAMTPKEVDLVPSIDRKWLIRSQAAGSSQDYMIHACRKEHVRLIFASSEEGGVLGRLRLCPLLIDLFIVMPGGKRTLVGGAGGYRYTTIAASPSKRTATPLEKGFDYKCTCVPKLDDDDDAAEEAEEAARLKLEAASGGLASGVKEEMKNDSDDEMGDTVDESFHVSLGPNSSAFTATSSPRRVGLAERGIARSPPGSGSGSHALGSHPDGAANINSINWQRKHAKQAKIIEKMKAELASVHEERGLWEQKYNDERDHNVRLWEKMTLIQKQLRDMSRPLGVSLTHAMNHISTATSAPQQQQQQQIPQQIIIPQQHPIVVQQHQQLQQQQQPQQQQAQVNVGIAAPPSQPMSVSPSHPLQLPNGYVYASANPAVASGVVDPAAQQQQPVVTVDPFTGAPAQQTNEMQIQQHLHTQDLQANYPANIQNQLTKQRLMQQQQQPMPLHSPMQQ